MASETSPLNLMEPHEGEEQFLAADYSNQKDEPALESASTAEEKDSLPESNIPSEPAHEEELVIVTETVQTEVTQTCTVEDSTNIVVEEKRFQDEEVIQEEEEEVQPVVEVPEDQEERLLKRNSTSAWEIVDSTNTVLVMDPVSLEESIPSPQEVIEEAVEEAAVEAVPEERERPSHLSAPSKTSVVDSNRSSQTDLKKRRKKKKMSVTDGGVFESSPVEARTDAGANREFSAEATKQSVFESTQAQSKADFRATDEAGTSMDDASKAVFENVPKESVAEYLSSAVCEGVEQSRAVFENVPDVHKADVRASADVAAHEETRAVFENVPQETKANFVCGESDGEYETDDDA